MAHQLNLEGNLTVDRAVSLKREFLSLLTVEDEVAIDMSAVTQIDLSFIQLLYAAEREAERLDKRFRMNGTLAQAVRDTLEVGGFCRQAPENASELESSLFEFTSMDAGVTEAYHD